MFSTIPGVGSPLPATCILVLFERGACRRAYDCQPVVARGGVSRWLFVVGDVADRCWIDGGIVWWMRRDDNNRRGRGSYQLSFVIINSIAGVGTPLPVIFILFERGADVRTIREVGAHPSGGLRG